MSEDEFKEKVLSELATLQEQTQRINVAVLGDEAAKIKGLAGRVEDAEKYIDKDKMQKRFAAGIFAAIVTAYHFIFGK